MNQLRKKRSCGSGWTRRLVPDWWPWTGWLSDCCREHDYWYARGGDEADRRLADENLYRCILAKTPPVPVKGLREWACVYWLRRRRWRRRRFLVLSTARAYRDAVRLFGAQHFAYRRPYPEDLQAD